jgi:hypothetical protein
MSRVIEGISSFHLDHITLFILHIKPHPRDFTTLEIDGIAPARGTWEVMPYLDPLSKLVVTPGEVRAGDAARFWRAYGRLQFLSLTRVHIQGGLIPQYISFHRMKCVRFFGISRQDADFDENVQLDMASRCPRLQGIDWEAPNAFGVSNAVYQGKWPDLEALHISIRLRDSSWSGPELQEPMLRHSHLRVESARQIRRRRTRQIAFHSLTLVNASGPEYRVSSISTAVRDMPCTCPNLTSLRPR